MKVEDVSKIKSGTILKRLEYDVEWSDQNGKPLVALQANHYAIALSNVCPRTKNIKFYCFDTKIVIPEFYFIPDRWDIPT